MSCVVECFRSDSVVFLSCDSAVPWKAKYFDEEDGSRWRRAVRSIQRSRMTIVLLTATVFGAVDAANMN